MRAACGASTTPSRGLMRAMSFVAWASLWALAPGGAAALPLTEGGTGRAERGADHGAPDLGRTALVSARPNDPLDLRSAPLSFSLEPERRPAVFFDMHDWRDELADRFGLTEPGFGLSVPAAPGAGSAAPSDSGPEAKDAAPAKDNRRQAPLPAALPLLGLALALLALATRRRRG